MGNCASIRMNNRGNGLPAPDALEYPRSANIMIKLRDPSLKVLYKEKVIFPMTEPVPAVSKECNLGSKAVWVSGIGYIVSSLPGTDPRGMVAKHHQDMCFFDVQDNSLLAGLFDGHGKEGQAVVTFCKNFVLNFYKRNQSLCHGDPSRFLMVLTHDCDRELTNPESGIDASYSGSTMVLMLIYQDTVHIASVGDSRAILATTSLPLIVSTDQPPKSLDPQFSSHRKRKRPDSLEKSLQPVQLTKDQNPGDLEERERILRMGGVIKRLMDETGRNVGPWRVWRKDANYPGLAIARSLGDISGSEIGVISVPVISTHSIRTNDDFFLVAASDGVWYLLCRDVMDNQEVTDFVEAYRYACVKGTLPVRTDKVKPETCSIAQLLCEEARTRWFSIVEEEDVLIDDISCVIIELCESAMPLTFPPSRSYVPCLDAEDEPGLDAVSLPITHVRVRDPRRNSMSE